MNTEQIMELSDSYAKEYYGDSSSTSSKKRKALQSAVKTLVQERDEAQAETLEQARLCGMGSEREAALLATNANLVRDKLSDQAAYLAMRESRDKYQVAADKLAAENKTLRDALQMMVNYVETEDIKPLDMRIARAALGENHEPN